MLSQAVAVITGAGGGLGRVLTEAFAAEGTRLVLLDIPVALRRLQALVWKLKAESVVMRCDLRREQDVCRALDIVRRRWGRVDILINNAAVEGPTRAIERMSLKDWEQTLRVNLTGPFLCARECVPLMRSHGGSIVQIGSVAGRIAYRLRAPYAVSKAALEALTRGLAAELQPYNIRVNLVAPGPIRGSRMERVIRQRARATGLSKRSIRQTYLRASSLGRMVEADEVARLVLFLCSEAGTHITGQVLEVSAGWRMQAL